MPFSHFGFLVLYSYLSNWITYCIMSNYWDTRVVPQYKVESFFVFFLLGNRKKLRTCLGALSSSSRMSVVLTLKILFLSRVSIGQCSQCFASPLWHFLSHPSTQKYHPWRISQCTSSQRYFRQFDWFNTAQGVWMVNESAIESTGHWSKTSKLAVPLTLENSHKCTLY